MHVLVLSRSCSTEAGGDPFQLAKRIEFLGTYKFLFITENVLETGLYVTAESSHAFPASHAHNLFFVYQP
jgi:hypothetical protein